MITHIEIKEVIGGKQQKIASRQLPSIKNANIFYLGKDDDVFESIEISYGGKNTVYRLDNDKIECCSKYINTLLMQRFTLIEKAKVLFKLTCM